MTAHHSPCLSKWQQHGLREKQLEKGGAEGGVENEGERSWEGGRKKGGMEGLSR